MINIILYNRAVGRRTCKQIARLSGPGQLIAVDRENRRLFSARIGHIFRWGCTVPVPHEGNDYNSTNHSANKGAFREMCELAGVSVPRVVRADMPDADLPARIIVRPRKHCSGRNVYLARDDSYRSILARVSQEFGPGAYAAEYIEKDREFRIFCADNRIVCVAEKFVTDPQQAAWNNSHGGSLKNVRWKQWPKDACRQALKAMALSGLSFGAVDVIQKDDIPYVLEINAGPTITSEYRLGLHAKVFNWMCENDPLEPGETRKYKQMLHPAVLNAES